MHGRHGGWTGAIAGRARLAAALAALALAGCAAPPARLVPSEDAATPMWLDAQGRPRTFAAYAEEARRRIAARNTVVAAQRTPADREAMAALVGPHEWPRAAGAGTDCTAENTDALLLVHGLTDSAFLMRDLGDALARAPLAPGRCTMARSLLLPGHGTVPGDLLRVRYETWLAATEWGVRSFAGKADRVHLVGFSTGGALGMLAAYRQHPQPGAPALASLVLVSPALQPLDRRAQKPLVLRLLAASGLKSWLGEHDDGDFAKYESFALNGGAQVARLAQVLDREEGPFPLPVFIALSLDDHTVNSRVTVERFLARSVDGSRLWLAAPGAAAHSDPLVRRAAADPRARVVDAAAAPDVRDIAHPALPVRPGNPHYGRGGDYVDCLAYDDDGLPPGDAWCACLGARPARRPLPPACEGRPPDRAVVYGELPVPPAASAGPLLRRLTFNPLFDDMAAGMLAFLRRQAAEGVQP
ncbi:alpha/beta hydrolase [Pseudorhodoferax sp.]|uniref:alpha/beta hydrolase n=1 Tax=Pseudorhodoferax sp. TaxID=1993553 RepID=UPI0039E369CF